MKNFISKIASKLGLELRRASSVPFGVRWENDMQFYIKGRKLATILDVGANTGQTALKVARCFPDSRIYSFEPVPSTFNELVRNTKADKRIEPVCCALGAKRGSALITKDPLSETNTLVVDVGSDPNAKSLLEIKVDTVDQFCAERGIQRVNLLKIDTEGYEINVLKGANQLLAEKRVDFILAECDFFRRAGEPHGDFIEIFNHVSGFGFSVVSFYTGGVDDLGWIWGNVLFRETSRCKPGRVAASPSRR